MHLYHVGAELRMVHYINSAQLVERRTVGGHPDLLTATLPLLGP